MFTRLIKNYSLRARKKRGRVFSKNIHFTSQTSLLDLGGADGQHIASVLGNREANVCIADISDKKLAQAKERYGFDTLRLDESGTIPGLWDVIFCSSVIEHVTVDKEEIYKMTSGKEFNGKSFERQKKLAEEIRAKGKSYFVQTPYKYFIFESHTWLPNILVFLSRKWQIRFIKFTNKFWIKKANPDFRLLTKRDMKTFFPDAEIIEEKSFGFTKSLIAVRK